MEDVVVESIKIMGHDCWYVPREGFDATDPIYGENANSKFDRAYHMEFYLANVEGYEGDGDFFSKFGLEIRDTSNFICSRRSFEKYVPSSIAIRPREGDLVFVPVLQKLFEIKFVEEELLFHSIGKKTPYIYELRCEMFRYSQENINTGISVIDDIEKTKGYSIEIDVTVGSGNYEYAETVYQGANLAYATVSASVSDWAPLTKKLEVINIKGTFTTNTTLVGANSNARFTVSTTDEMGDHIDYDTYDNRYIQTEANTFIDFTESNPFGNP